MIAFVDGNILSKNKSDRSVLICHQVNCCGVMGKGLAGQIKKKYPEVYKEYRRYCSLGTKTGANILGTVTYWAPDTASEENIIIANLFGQQNYGRDRCYTDYHAVRSCIKRIRSFAEEHDCIIRIPYGMGAGLAGGDWRLVYTIIYDELKDMNVEIWRI